MGISDSKQALLFEAIEDGVFWFECPTRDANLLRPNFMGSWSDNAEWRNDMIHYVREKACEVYPQLHADRLAQKTDTDIVRQLREVFENTKEVVKKGAKGAEMVVAKKIKQRQTARKGRVSIFKMYTKCQTYHAICTRKILKDQLSMLEGKLALMVPNWTGFSKCVINLRMSQMLGEETVADPLSNLSPILRWLHKRVRRNHQGGRMQTLFGLLDPQCIEMSRSDKENTA
jgi:hypothetical protein